MSDTVTLSREVVESARFIAMAYAASNPKWDYAGEMQDPGGAHACYEALKAALAAPQPEPTIKESFTVAEQSRELDAGMAAQHYCRGLWGAARGHSDWRKVHEHFSNGYKQGVYDNEMAQGPYPWPDDPLDLELRGLLASKLQCWHRLNQAESTELVALFESLRPQPEPQPVKQADGWKLVPICLTPAMRVELLNANGLDTTELYTMLLAAAPTTKGAKL